MKKPAHLLRRQVTIGRQDGSPKGKRPLPLSLTGLLLVGISFSASDLTLSELQSSNTINPDGCFALQRAVIFTDSAANAQVAQYIRLL